MDINKWLVLAYIVTIINIVINTLGGQESWSETLLSGGCWHSVASDSKGLNLVGMSTCFITNNTNVSVLISFIISKLLSVVLHLVLLQMDIYTHQQMVRAIKS